VTLSFPAGGRGYGGAKDNPEVKLYEYGYFKFFLIMGIFFLSAHGIRIQGGLVLFSKVVKFHPVFRVK
jgi:hypothetical protein